MKNKFILIGICIILLFSFTACSTEVPNEEDKEIIIDEEDNVEDKGIEYEYTDEGIIKPEIAEEVIKNTSDKVINSLKNKDMDTLSSYVHPVKGIRFTPYTYVSLEEDIVFSYEEMKDFLENQNEYLWGSYDGTGDEIKLTPSAYYDKFVYAEDYINAEKIGYNTVLSFGNMLENQFEVYENPIVVEYYFSGFNPEYEGMDWRSIRLVFEEYEGKWYLVGIINNQWTI